MLHFGLILQTAGAESKHVTLILLICSKMDCFHQCSLCAAFRDEWEIGWLVDSRKRKITMYSKGQWYSFQWQKSSTWNVSADISPSVQLIYWSGISEEGTFLFGTFNPVWYKKRDSILSFFAEGNLHWVLDLEKTLLNCETAASLCLVFGVCVRC